MPATLKKIAELAGVSIGTVDRALHGRPGVNQDVASRILEIAHSLGYKPNIMAKALSIKRNPLRIGVIFHVDMNPFYEKVVEGIKAASDGIKDFGISVLIKYGHDFDVEDQLKLIDGLIADGVNALVIVPLNDERITRKINELTAARFPVMLLVSDLENASRLAYVGCNVFKVGQIAGGLTGIVCNGRGNVLYATSHLSMLGNYQRLKGFEYALESRFPEIRLVDICEFDNDEILTYKKATEVFQSLSKIDAIVIATGSIKGIFEALKDAGLEHKVKVIALDLSKHVQNGIKESIVTASIVQHPFTHGYKAIRLLADYFITGAVPQQADCNINCDISIYESLF